MIRNIDINEISDGKRYRRTDMAKLGCQDCAGCSSCCHDMENTVLDPWDIWQLTSRLECGFNQLLDKHIELKIIDNLTLPQLKMGESQKGCSFLNNEGRCSIHTSRPGVCRLFPLGRIYEEDGFSYFLQINECKKNNRSKVKIEKWLGIPDIVKYEKYILDWHNFLKNVREHMDGLSEEQMRTLHMLILRQFFIKEYTSDSFYEEFENRRKEIEQMLF